MESLGWSDRNSGNGCLNRNVVGGCILVLEKKLESIPLPVVIWGGVGLIGSLLMAGLIGLATGLIGIDEYSVFSVLATLVLFLSLPYWGLCTGTRFGKEGLIDENLATSGNTKPAYKIKLLDTSVIIDGRIADLCETGFIEGTLIVPHFILQELQHISDSSDGLKRARGRRGLDILNVLQKMTNIQVKLVEDDFPHVQRSRYEVNRIGETNGWEGANQ